MTQALSGLILRETSGPTRWWGWGYSHMLWLSTEKYSRDSCSISVRSMVTGTFRGVSETTRSEQCLARITSARFGKSRRLPTGHGIGRLTTTWSSHLLTVSSSARFSSSERAKHAVCPMPREYYAYEILAVTYLFAGVGVSKSVTQLFFISACSNHCTVRFLDPRSEFWFTFWMIQQPTRMEYKLYYPQSLYFSHLVFFSGLLRTCLGRIIRY